MELAVERRGAIEIWTIQGEARRNSLTMALLRELKGRVEAAASDRSLRVVVLSGQGDRAFCAGDHDAAQAPALLGALQLGDEASQHGAGDGVPA